MKAQTIMEELERINNRLTSVNARLKHIEARQDKADLDISDIREDRLGQKEMLGAISQGLDRIHERLGPIQSVYDDVPNVLGRLESKLDKVANQLENRPCMVTGDCVVGS